MLEGQDIHFDIVGPIGIARDIVDSAPSNITFCGSVSRDLAADYYRKADVFVLPTLSDGFAITQLEAMAYGLPVITTPHCGKVVTEGRRALSFRFAMPKLLPRPSCVLPKTENWRQG